MDGARRIDDEQNVPVGRVVTAVFGDLRAARIYRSDLRDPEHVWVVRVGVRDAEEVRRLVTSEDLPQAGVLDSNRIAGVVDCWGGMRPQVVLDELSGRLRAVRQPPQ